MELKIDPRFNALLPDLADEELAALRASIQAEGCREPIAIWHGTIVDGHNRYAICRELGTPFKTREMDFVDNDAAMDWIDANQIARRNLTPDAFKLALGRRYNRTKKGVGKPAGTILGQVDPISTADRLATEHGVSAATVKRAGKFAQEVDADPELQEAIRHRKPVAKAKKAKQLDEAKARYAIARNATETDPVIVRADAFEFLPLQPDCDLLLTDPPYMTDVEDIAAFAETWLPIALAKVKPTGRAYIFVGAYPEELRAYLSVAMPTQVLVWTYRNTIGPCAATRYNLNWQAILYYCGADAPPLESPILTERWAVQDVNAPDGRQGNRLHKWQKPDELAERIIRHATLPGQLVLDPFCGSGTFVLAAARLGRIGHGCDVEWSR